MQASAHGPVPALDCDAYRMLDALMLGFSIGCVLNGCMLYGMRKSRAVSR